MRKARVKSDGTVELPETRCPRCGTKNLGLNVTTRAWYCWVCDKGGYLLPGVAVSGAHPPTERPAGVAPLTTIPDTARRFIERRGLDPRWLEDRYLVRWDGERLHWPCGAGLPSQGVGSASTRGQDSPRVGASRRAIWPWEQPKTLTVPPRGLIGQHLLTKGARVVITEGDFKAASIPLPWIGVGVLGDAMSPDQALALQASEPSEVVIMLDGGMRRQAEKIRELLCPLDSRIVDLPLGQGPDDVDRGTLYRVLVDQEGR